eukprot:416503-Pleurochrysis_carterae.AAC.1
MQLLVLDERARGYLPVRARLRHAGRAPKKGTYMVVMHLPLKVRANNYKPETEAHYCGAQELRIHATPRRQHE